MGLVKICGVRSVTDALLCEDADEIGLNFVPGRARAIDLATARAILQASSRRAIAVVADPDDALVDALLDLGFESLQLHGQESPARCRELAARARVTKAISVTGPEAVRGADAYPGERVLFDAGAGGTGTTFDWSWLALAGPRPYLLAGGLRPDNVAAAIERTPAVGVDVASGVESSIGVKDAEKVRAFVRNARAAFAASA